MFLSLDLVGLVGRLVSSLEFGKSFGSELEVLRFVDKSQTEDYSNKIALSGIVIFIVIVVDDEIASVGLGSADVLEALKIVRVSEDVIAVNALQVLAIMVSFGFLKLCPAVIGHDFHASQVTSAILLFFN